MKRVFCEINTLICSFPYLCTESLHETHSLHFLTHNFFSILLLHFYDSFESRSQLSLSFFLALIRLPTSSLVYNGIVLDSSILYPDFIRNIIWVLLNWICRDWLEYLAGAISSIHSELEPACHENYEEYYNPEYKTSVHRGLLWMSLLEADDKALIRTFNGYMSASSYDVVCFFIGNENDKKWYELWFETITNACASSFCSSIWMTWM